MNGRILRIVSAFSLSTVLIAIVLFGGSPLTVSSLLLLDVVVTTVRMILERLAAGCRLDTSPATGGVRPLEPLYEKVSGKRGRFRLHTRLPPVYPRNIPYAIELWSVLLLLGIPTGLFWGVGGVPVGPLEATALVAAPAVVARQYLLVRAQMTDGTYEAATSRTIRGAREFVYLAAVAALGAILVGASGTGELLVANVLVFVAPKLLFDIRDAGLGPWPLRLDQTADEDQRGDTDTLVTSPLETGDKKRQFCTDWQTVRRIGVSDGVSYSLLSMFILTTVVGGVGLFSFESLQTTLVAAAVTAIVTTLATTAVVTAIHWLGAANEQYRVYDDCVVAYDTFLEEPQWRVSADEVTRVSRGDTRPGLQIPKILDTMPYSEYPVVIERGGDDPIEVEKLSDPEGFADAVRELGRRSIDTSTAARTRE